MCIKKNHRAFAFNSHVVAFLNSLFNPLNYVYIYIIFLSISILSFYTKKRHENVCIQQIKNCNLITNFKKAEKRQVKFVIHSIHKWRTRRKKLAPSRESEALEDKQILQMKTAQM